MLIATFFVAKTIFWAITSVITAMVTILVVSLVISAYKSSKFGSGEAIGRQPLAKSAKKAIGIIPITPIADFASSQFMEASMTHDKRLALVDSEGEERFAAIINGKFQIGKERERVTEDIVEFARAILIDGKDGRFICADGRKPGILKFSGKAFEAKSFRLDRGVAQKLGLPTVGQR